jgi:hypothetical protein
VQSAAVQHAAFATHVPSAQVFSLAVARFVSHPSPSGGALEQSPQPAAQPVYVHPPGPHAAPMLLPEVVSHVTPHAVQLLIVSSGWHAPEQQPLPAGHPCVASHPALHWLFTHVAPSAQFESVRQPTHACVLVLQTAPPLAPVPPSVAPSADASAGGAPPSASAAQSALFLHPAAHDVPAQYWPTGQLSLDGRHWTQVFDVVSHQGVAPWHCELTTHATQAPALHTSPVGHGCVEVHPGTQAFALQTSPAAQSPSARHATHVSLVVRHLGVGAAQLPSVRHPTHAFVVVSHTLPVGHVLDASQPFAQALFTQRCPGAQSLETRHATHAVCPLHFWPPGQSPFVPQRTHEPDRHTWPVVLVAQSAFVVHPPPAAAPSGFASGPPAVASPPPLAAASLPPGLPCTNDCDPLAHPDGLPRSTHSIQTGTSAVAARRSLRSITTL